MSEAGTSRVRSVEETGGCECERCAAAVPVSPSCSCQAKADFKRLVACGQVLFKDLGEHKYGCLLGKIPEPIAGQIREWAQNSINKEHLGPGGIEDEVHVTVKYGFKDSSPDTIQGLKDLLSQQEPIHLSLGNFSYFDGDNPDGWPLYLQVASPDLIKLNAEISSVFPCEDKHPIYTPHVTMAYIDPRFMDGYSVLEGLPFQEKQVILTLSELEWSGADEVKETIKLRSGVKDLSPEDEDILDSLWEEDDIEEITSKEKQKLPSPPKPPTIKPRNP